MNWNVSDEAKICPICNDEFFASSNRQIICGSFDCHSVWRRRHRTKTLENYCKDIIQKKARSQNLSVDVLINLWNKQNGLCALTKVAMTFDAPDTMTQMSIDRIIAGGVYCEDNIQLVCVGVNRLRSSMPIDEFIWWCRKVVDNA